jgi:hypothetical protein
MDLGGVVSGVVWSKAPLQAINQSPETSYANIDVPREHHVTVLNHVRDIQLLLG